MDYHTSDIGHWFAMTVLLFVHVYFRETAPLVEKSFIRENSANRRSKLTCKYSATIELFGKEAFLQGTGSRDRFAIISFYPSLTTSILSNISMQPSAG